MPSVLTMQLKVGLCSAYHSLDFLRVLTGWTNEDWKKATSKIKFYRFTNPNLSTTVYQELPSLAYTNDDAWRTFVPIPGEVLGVVLPSRSEF